MSRREPVLEAALLLALAFDVGRVWLESGWKSAGLRLIAGLLIFAVIVAGVAKWKDSKRQTGDR